MPEQDVYSVQEVACRYNVSAKTVTRWIDLGLFPGATKKNPFGINSPYEIPQSALDYYEEKRKAANS